MKMKPKSPKFAALSIIRSEVIRWLRPAEVKILYELWARSFPHDLKFRWGFTELSDKIGVTRTEVYKAFEELCQAGLIVVERRPTNWERGLAFIKAEKDWDENGFNYLFERYERKLARRKARIAQRRGCETTNKAVW